MNAISSMTEYATYLKPEWAPPSWLFGPVWTFLYAIIAVTFGFVFYRYFKKKLRPSTALPFAFNLLFNLLYTPIMFGLGDMLLATLDILLVLTTLIVGLIAVRRKHAWVALANLPYLLWVSFATVLQISILYLNRGA
jgi:benzodiazapine receptor